MSISPGRKSIIILIMITNLYFAQEEMDSTKTYNFDPIVITGTRFYQAKSKIASSISVIDKSTIEESFSPNVLSIVNSRVPGLFINDRNMIGMGAGPNSAGGISIRGIGGQPNSQVLILIDGQPQFMGMFGHPFPDTYMSSDVERVEIIRGPASILYGSNGFGGAMNLITRKNNISGFFAKASASFGSFDTRDISVSSGIKFGSYSLLLSANNLNTDGYRKDGDSKFSSSSLYLNGGVIINEQLNLRVDGNISDSKYYDPGTEQNPLRNNFYNYLRSRAALSLDNKFENSEGALRLFLNYGKHDFYDGWNSEDYNTGLTLYQNFTVINNSVITLGFDYKKFGGKGSNTKIPAMIKGLNEFHWIREADLYFLYQYYFPFNLNVNGGLRYTNNSVYGNNITPQVGFSYIISQSSTIKGSVGKAFRSPTVLDLYLYPVSNSSLNPEKLWSYELSFSQFILDRKLFFELTGFYCRGTDMIQAVSLIGGLPPQKINTGSFINKGIEASLDAMIENALNLHMSYSYLKSNIVLKYAPEHSLNFNADYSFSNFTVNLSYKMIKNLINNIANKNAIDFSRVDVTLGYKISSNIKTYLSADNLFDSNYQIDFGYPAAPFNLSVGVRISN